MKKRSIRQWITLCFSVILGLSVAVTAAWNYYHTYSRSVEESRKAAECCASLVRYSLDSWDIDALMHASDDEQYRQERSTLRALSRSFDFEYLYIYTVDPETEVRHFLFCVASDDDKENVVLRERYLGAVADEPLDKWEKALLAGEREMQMGKVSTQYGDDITWLVPYTEGDGPLLAVIGMDHSIAVENAKILKDFLFALIPVVLSLTMGLLVLLILLRRRILRPIHALSESMSRFARDSSVKPEPIGIRTQDEIGEIAASYEKMTSDIVVYVNNIEALTKERVEANVQLDVARRIQYGLVPEKTKLSGDGFSLYAVTQPAKAVGGDFYDCFLRDGNTVCAVLGDVSGKGVSAAIFMAMAKTMIHEKLLLGLSPSETLNQVNDALCDQNPEGLFATAFAVVFDPRSGKVQYANAGHTPPILIGEESRFLRPDCGFALGLFEDAGILEDSLELRPGEGLLLYTDGVTEAVGPQRSLFGEARLLEALKHFRTSADAAEESVRTLKEAVDRFTAGNEPFDDTAILALFRLAERVWKNVPVDLSSFSEMKKAVFAALGETAQARKVLLVCDEMLANIVNYSGATDLAFCCEKDGDMLRIGFSDNGRPFDPTNPPDDEKEFDLLDGGGMGLGIVLATADSVEYERKDDRNVSILCFDL
ncbi:MAG: SpoIIE family protein phosphatase [Clostridia bacterium]|nr:SpoIIE family protein phosphatase [Clostridia bacterium]